MAWFKIDDGLAFHPKVIAAGNSAMGLWVRAGAYCAAHLTDGRLPRAMLGPLGGRVRDTQKLVDCGLWEATPEGWTFRNWHEFQPTKTQVEQERRATADRVKAWRERRSNTVTNGVTNGVTNAVGTPAPSRPDPSRKREGGATRATRLPDTWQPTPEHETRAREAGVDIDREIVKFRTHAEDKGRTSKSWNAAFTQWLIKAAEYAQRDGRTQAATSGSVWTRGPV